MWCREVNAAGVGIEAGLALACPRPILSVFLQFLSVYGGHVAEAGVEAGSALAARPRDS
jgi:hypothetical protein